MIAGRRFRVAVMIPGGIGTGRGNIGVPVLEQQITLLARDFDIVVFSLFKVNSDYRAKGFEIVSIPAKGFLFKAWSVFNVFRKMNGEKKFDVIHGFWALPSGFLVVALGKYFKIRTVVSVLGGDAASLPAINYGQLRRRIPRTLVRWTIRNADKVTALTGYLVDNLKKEGIARRDIMVLPWGISNSQFLFSPVPVAIPVSFLHVANFSPVKDQLTLLAAFKLISAKVDCHLTMIGEGAMAPRLQEWIRKNGLSEKITMKSPVRYEDLPAFYHRAMILLHTSLSEGQSEVVTEAMSSGVIVCGTQVGLLHDLPGCCVAVPVRDYERLAEEVLRIITDDERIASIRINARDWTQIHNIGWTVKATGDIYRKVSLTGSVIAGT